MKNSIYVDQFTLEYWVGRKLNPSSVQNTGKDRQRYLNRRFDAVDALIGALIQDLNPEDPAVKKWMYKGHFLVKLEYLRERIPILDLAKKSAADTLYRRLRWLRMMGILDCLNRTGDGKKTLAYYRLSRRYWQIRARRHEAATRAAKAIIPSDDGSRKRHLPQGPGPSSTGSMQAFQESHSSPLQSLPSDVDDRPSGVGTERVMTREERIAAMNVLRRNLSARSC
jgi:hypothetical protein